MLILALNMYGAQSQVKNTLGRFGGEFNVSFSYGSSFDTKNHMATSLAYDLVLRKYINYKTLRDAMVAVALVPHFSPSKFTIWQPRIGYNLWKGVTPFISWSQQMKTSDNKNDPMNKKYIGYGVEWVKKIQNTGGMIIFTLSKNDTYIFASVGIGMFKEKREKRKKK